MNILMRVSNYREVSKGKRVFSLTMLIKILLSNFRKLFTENLLSGNEGAFKEIGGVLITEDDKSLVFEKGNLKWIDTPKEKNSITLDLSSENK